MTDLARLIDVLLHDLRAPLGVAHGYLRLIREQRLGSDEERERALDRTQDALARMSRLCDEASALAAVPSVRSPEPMSADDLAARVAAQLAGAHTSPSPAALEARPAPGVHVLIQGEPTRLAEAIALILATTSDGSATTARVEAGHLRFAGRQAAAPMESRGAVHDGAFDPWLRRTARQGLALPLACADVERAGGSVLTTDGRDVVITLPVETNIA